VALVPDDAERRGSAAADPAGLAPTDTGRIAMGLQEQLQQDLKTALRAGDRERVSTIRMALAALQSAQMAQVKAAYDQASAAAGAAEGEAEVAIDRDAALSDEAALNVLAKEVKRRREAAELYTQGGRPDLAASEEREAAILEAYLPRQLTADELRPLVAATLADLGARGPGDMGRVMPVLMQQFKGRADGRLLSQLARELLGQR
jgi:uncharacterized protein YqeY